MARSVSEGWLARIAPTSAVLTGYRNCWPQTELESEFGFTHCSQYAFVSMAWLIPSWSIDDPARPLGLHHGLFCLLQSVLRCLSTNCPQYRVQLLSYCMTNTYCMMIIIFCPVCAEFRSHVVTAGVKANVMGTTAWHNFVAIRNGQLFVLITQ